MSEILERAMSLHTRLETLRDEHRQLDDTITLLCQKPMDDELALRRLKKRKLIVRDRINLIERMIAPNLPA
ncbi:YdcH family protein [Uliginosibacterium sp. H1]|uniref:YdcH family protein n=1 Tax=Uliginosibacterium sp. H1 TaxID=3114757 RepID=UPI002E17980E|nr:YdcH family protein [Uliginosibacterium sp. H1]